MPFNQTSCLLGSAVLLGAALLSGGCASTGPTDERDPLEGFNRAMHGFNETFDETLGKPVATGYQNITPEPVDRGVTNVFSNVDDLLVIANQLLQGKLGRAASDTGRVLMNSTFGIFGFIDVASDMGMPKHREDFGQTLGYWGMGTGPYIVVPFLGPSNARDLGGTVAESFVDPLLSIDHVPTRNALEALKHLDMRADLLSATTIIDTAALDKYSFVRDAYLQRRNYLVNDGNVPEDEGFEEPGG